MDRIDDDSIITAVSVRVRTLLESAEKGHDWLHTQRVYHMALEIARTENVNRTIVALAALLHDIGDAKFHQGDESVGPRKAREVLADTQLLAEDKEHIIKIIQHISFRSSIEKTDFYSLELAVVQDADRLDAMGAIGIARAFHYGGFKNRAFYDPMIKPILLVTKDSYTSNTGPTINHFYEKLLLLKDRMNTKMGQELASHRHEFMLLFLKEFYSEIGTIPPAE
jgi:uncharacterized protein